jgi:hypothetical protein
MKTKRILAAIIAAAAALTMTATAAFAEGLESDEVGLDEEPATTEPAEEVVVTVPEEETPVAPVENPPTGNSAVALAVVPVALAAAAIVAKKRK